MLSAVMEDYLKSIYYLQMRGDDDLVRTSAIAENLDVTAPTVTSMIDKLAERGLVEREKYQGVRLSTDGERIALEVIRHHRLIESYLTEHLDYSWEEVHDEADRLEHHISENFEERMAAALDHPEVDPHGAPIPAADLSRPRERVGAALSEFQEGDVVVVEEVDDRDPEVLGYLSEHGIDPGTVLHILEVAPFGMITTRPADATTSVSLPERIARDVRVSTST